VEPSTAATVFASSFASALELVREGLAEIHQHQAFAPIYMRKRTAVAAVVSEPAQESAQGAAIDRTED
jgi:segregation and condensation protein A